MKLSVCGSGWRWSGAIAGCLVSTGVIFGWEIVATAQAIPDGTLSTSVTQSGNHFTITNGNQVGTNLFHSFSQFSVPTGGSAYFNNSAAIQTIFARVTGGSASNIDGLIHANGTTNLFLLNPAGILFGPNAGLNIGGSLVASTANSIVFADGTKFSAINPTSLPLLTMSVPVGLQMGNNPGAIVVQGSGHNAQLSNSDQVSGLSLGTRGLQVQPGKTLALVGANLSLNGGLLSAPGGHIELGGVTGGSIGITPVPQGFSLSYTNVTSFGDIQMTQRALASTRDLTSGNGGSIQFQGGQVSIKNGSLVLIQNRSSQTAGDITINASELLQISGKTPNFLSSSSLINETISSGAAGNIVLNTPQLSIDQGGFVLNRTFSAATGGNIIVNAKDMHIDGFAVGDPSAFRSVSQLVASAHSTGKGGDVRISARNLLVSAGANVAARPYGSGDGGNVMVNADTIQVTTAGAPSGTYFSLISTATFGLGNSGNLQIDTRTLSVLAGGRVSASSIVLGNAGSLTINASESVEVRGIKDATNPSYIGTAVRPVGGVSNARAGDTTINTPVLTIRDGGTVFVQNLGSGQAGNLTIHANRLHLENGASISASTRSGSGGNINLQLRDLLLMRYRSMINAEAGGSGNGGNITIKAPIILGLENSDIIANAVQGRGGNIQIVTQALLGLKFRPELTPENDITASSQFGVSGTVQVNTIGVDPNAGLVKLPADIADPSQQIATGCADTQGSSFVATGRGGVPQNPTQQVMHNRPWNDLRDLSTYRPQDSSVVAQMPPSPRVLILAPSPPHGNATVVAQMPPSPRVLIQATTWQRNPDGTVELIAESIPTTLPMFATCSGLSARAADADE